MNDAKNRLTDATYELVIDAQNVGMSKHDMAKMIDEAWDYARRESVERELKLTITVK